MLSLTGENALTDQAIELIEPDDKPSREIATRPSRDNVLMALIQRNLSPSEIQQMMDLRDRQDAFEAEKAYREAFAEFRGENVIIPKTKYVDRGKGGSFVQAEYHVVADRLSPALSKHGFGFRHDQKFGAKRWMTDGVENDIPWVWVTCFLEHRAGHAEKLELEGPPGDQSVNSPVQNMQVTASLLKRQSLLAITGTATGGEDDESAMYSSGDADEEKLTKAGQEASMEGTEALTKWWQGLTAKERNKMQRAYGELRKVAAKADEHGAKRGKE